AKKAIDEEAAKVSEAIDHDVTLTDSEKGTQKQAVADEAKKAKQAIDTADNADGVDQAVTKGIQIIDAQHQSGQALTDRKAAAKKAIDAEAAKVGQAIEQDPTLTATEKKRTKNKPLQTKQQRPKRRLILLLMLQRLTKQKMPVLRPLMLNTSLVKLLT
ncbi:hypothetical protein PY67_08735, partial [Lacticaseibacillus rhamnosus]